MDVLKAEILKKRKQLEDSQLVNANKKYFRRGDLLAKEAEVYLLKHPAIKEQVESISKSNEEEDRNENSDKTLARPEVIIRLRDRGEPITLFGETEVDAFKRLRQCEILEPEVDKGFRNDFQEAMDSVDQAYLDEMYANTKVEDEKSEAIAKQEVTYDQIKQMAKSMGRGNREHDMTVIRTFLELLLKMWKDQLQKRSAAEKTGTKGKLIGATYRQTQEYLKPLLRKLKNFSLSEDISDSLTEIAEHLLNRNYLKASDAYLQMAIGNAPWPIGVTMVGIHARTGREKIFSKNVAHVMNDETQRKYIQALKRLMTKCQEYYVTDPSRCVEYTPPVRTESPLEDSGQTN